MKIGVSYSHFNGREWLMGRRRSVWNEIRGTIKAIDAKKFHGRGSRKKSKMGNIPVSAMDVNDVMRAAFAKQGWRASRYDYMVSDDYKLTAEIMPLSLDEQMHKLVNAGKPLIASYNQTDFQKNRVAVEVQLGKYSFIEFDLFVKHLAFY